MQVFGNGKRYFYSFIEYYVIHLKDQEVKIWSKWHFNLISLILSIKIIVDRLMSESLANLGMYGKPRHVINSLLSTYSAGILQEVSLKRAM